ncbi:MAG: YcxB family protein [Cytophagia bacterium]|nr:MAG: YcxB family protein [Cytophagia bacterium]TAH29722.1 MAG: YcxB family protein [Cytophagales bacterium]
MKVITKKYQLSPKIYRTICMKGVLKKKWWQPLALFAGLFALNLLISLTLYYNYWMYIFAILAPTLWYLFWWVQFTASPNLPQLKPFFEKFMYEFTSRDIVLKVNAKEGVQLKWENIVAAEKTNEAFILHIGLGQILYLPFKIFNNDTDLKFMEEGILKRKNLLK